MLSIKVDRLRNLIVLTISGYHGRDAIAAFCGEIRSVTASLGDVPGGHDILCNLSDASVASGDTIAELMGILQNPAYHGLKARRLAFHTRSALFRLQLGRVVPAREGIAVFDTSHAAYEWLSQGRAAIAA